MNTRSCDRDSLKARIHFAINCGSNGRPPIRASAFQAEGLHEMLQLATQQFLASEWNCRIDHDTRRIYVSRIFKMYAQDFAGAAAPPAEYRLGVLRFVAENTGMAFERIANFDVVYNTYDWGLND